MSESRAHAVPTLPVRCTEHGLDILDGLWLEQLPNWRRWTLSRHGQFLGTVEELTSSEYAATPADDDTSPATFPEGWMAFWYLRRRIAPVGAVQFVQDSSNARYRLRRGAQALGDISVTDHHVRAVADKPGGGTVESVRDSINDAADFLIQTNRA